MKKIFLSLTVLVMSLFIFNGNVLAIEVDANEDTPNGVGFKNCDEITDMNECNTYGGCHWYGNNTCGKTTFCHGITDKKDCTGDCEWINNKCEASTKLTEYVSCGDVNNIPKELPKLSSLAFDLLKFAVPIILVLKASIDLLKASMAQKEDDMKKTRDSLVKKIVTAMLVFFVAIIMEVVVGIVGTTEESKSSSSCIDCFINNNCGKNF